jgi:hypothetical protein
MNPTDDPVLEGRRVFVEAPLRFRRPTGMLATSPTWRRRSPTNGAASGGMAVRCSSNSGIASLVGRVPTAARAKATGAPTRAFADPLASASPSATKFMRKVHEKEGRNEPFAGCGRCGR